ncbi:RNA polymerase sigma factor [Dyadobacter psychrotolerans]|uniref:Sigma-70 family RNA polymerase sigma factor n=1 Tax=Dyadobacter psychrotolerans TaxID=2541721 RepID=A0A4R5DS20_9BACT|nr:sigma-70 family RNA polymerase sigma factor [Dyadobacter psychrotolerans]TDE14861.1 sigma-70 family RNA polymerase sigma factor [Dyadobacter psychrotolerans]
MPLCSTNADETKHWHKLLNGDQQALAFFYERYADYLLKYGLSVTYNRDMVQDAVQELFINIWNRRQNLSVPDSVKYYLMVSLRRIILKDLLHARQSTDVFSEEALSFASHESLFADEYKEDVHLKLQHAVRLLPARQQEIIFLRFFQKLSYEQITTVTGLDYQILRNTIYRAIKTLRHSLSEKIALTSVLSIFPLLI